MNLQTRVQEMERKAKSKENLEVTPSPTTLVPVGQAYSPAEQSTEIARCSWDGILDAVHRLNSGKIRRILDSGAPVKALDALEILELVDALDFQSEAFAYSIRNLSKVGA